MKRVSFIFVLLALMPSVFSQKTRMSPALMSLVEAERAFARTSVEKGVRESFLEFFAEDGINFQPHPVKTRAAILQRPAPATRPPIVLNWEPAYADISNAGDLGYTTGPYTLTDTSKKNPTRYGFFFSIWKKQSDGNWKVVLDLGIDTPDHSQRSFALQAAPRVRLMKGKTKAGPTGANPLSEVEKEFLVQAKAGELAQTYLNFLDQNARIHRFGSFPFTERNAIRTYLLSKPGVMTWETIGTDVARSNDLGYTYGSYEMKSTTSRPEKGYYVRVWKLNRFGEWKIVLDTLEPLPPEGSK